MRGRSGICSVVASQRGVSRAALCGLVLAVTPRIAFASDLVVAVAPAAPASTPVSMPAEDDEREPPKKKRDGVAFAASLYAMTATAMDDFKLDELAFVARPALEAYVAIGLGEVSLLLGGTTLAIEVYAYDDRSSMNYPALFTMGVVHDRWLVEVAGGASLFTEDSAGPFQTIGDQPQIPSPRAEVRAGARFLNIFELRAVVSGERRIAPDSIDHSDSDRDSVTRYFAGAAFGIGGS